MEKHSKNEVKKISKKSIFYKKLFFQTLVEFFLEVLRPCLRYLIGDPNIRLCSRKKIRGADHVYEKIFTKNWFGHKKTPLFFPDSPIVPKSHDVTGTLWGFHICIAQWNCEVCIVLHSWAPHCTTQCNSSCNSCWSEPTSQGTTFIHAFSCDLPS